MTINLHEGGKRLQKRKRQERTMKGVLMAASSVSVLILVILLGRIISDGAGAMMSLDFWTQRYSSLNAMLGKAGLVDSLFSSVVVLIVTILFALPVGTAAGVYLHEYTSKGRIFRFIDASVANLAAVPSIVFGLFGLAVFVRMMHMGASYIAAGLTLGVLVLPMLIVSTQEALKTVPESVRHASLGLGASKWQTVRHHVLPYALPNILTGQILALSRAAGETAPLIVLGIPLYQSILELSPTGSGSPLQLRAYTLANLPDANSLALAGGAILLLMFVTLVLNLAAITLRARLQRKIRW